MKIIIFCLPGIGDALMATPMIKLLRKKHPHARIDIACMFKGVEYVFKNNHHVNHIYNLPLYKENKLKGFKAILKLQKNKYDISMLAFPAFRREYHLVQWWVGAKKRFAHRFRRGYITELNFLDSSLILADEDEHNVINNLNLLSLQNIDWKKNIPKKKIKYDLRLDNEDIRFGKDFLQKLGWEKNQVISIHPGSINSKAGVYKRWPIKNYVELINSLISKDKRIIIFVGPEEREIGENIFNQVNNKKHCYLLGNAKINQAIGILNGTSLYIGNDNGFAHLANALKIKSIVLFGPTNPAWCSPYNPYYSINIRKAKFIPWFRNDMKVTSPPKNAKSGMEKILVKDVIEAI